MNVKTFLIFLITIIAIILITSKTEIVVIKETQALERLFSQPVENIEIYLQQGEYYLTPKSIIDSTCGNCQDPDQPVSATAGLIIRGKNVVIRGPRDQSAVIHTNSGYGLFINNCKNFVLENITVTDGIRDTALYASDAAIVVKNSTASISNNIIKNNLGDSIQIQKNISGIMGICGRENSIILIRNNRILRNSWDGIALYRDSQALIRNNIIDGIDKAGGRKPLGGRGVAIGVTWNAEAEIFGNYIARYWKGIGIFVDAKVKAKTNILEDITTWGIALWDANTGSPVARLNNNLIYNLGAMGVSLSSKTKYDPGYLINNIIVKTAQDSVYDSPDYYGYQCALSEQAIPDRFIIAANLFYDNRRASEDLPDYDLTPQEFKLSLKPKLKKLERLPVWKQSQFYLDNKKSLK